MVKNWLEIDASAPPRIETFDNDVLRNQVWYRGKPAELSQFFSQNDDGVGNTSFWGATSSTGVSFRKIHSGIPALMVDTLADIVCSDLLTVTAGDGETTRQWNLLARENNFEHLLKRAVKTALAEGDGAFKISVDKRLSNFPVIEFYGASRVDYVYDRGRISAVIFKTSYEHDRKLYRLREAYTPNGVFYSLSGERGEVGLNSIPQTAELVDVVNHGRFMMAVPLMFDASATREGRGRSLFDGKQGAFDGLDECISQWIDALRDGRVKQYIPESMIPRNAENGRLIRPNAFDSRYVATGTDMREDAVNQIITCQPEIRTSALAETYSAFLELCLQGILSPSTLGIDLKKRDNADAQREKEKTTMYIRNRLVRTLQETLPRLVNAVLQTAASLDNPGCQLDDVAVAAEFGEFANPSFESRLESVGRAFSLGIMSAETVVEQLYGDTWTAEQKTDESKKLSSQWISPAHRIDE